MYAQLRAKCESERTLLETNFPLKYARCCCCCCCVTQSILSNSISILGQRFNSSSPLLLPLPLRSACPLVIVCFSGDSSRSANVTLHKFLIVSLPRAGARLQRSNHRGQRSRGRCKAVMTTPPQLRISVTITMKTFIIQRRTARIQLQASMIDQRDTCRPDCRASEASALPCITVTCDERTSSKCN